MIDSNKNNVDNGLDVVSEENVQTRFINTFESIQNYAYIRNIFHAFFLITAVFCFLPQMLGYSIVLDPYADDDLRILSDQEYYTTLVVSLAITTLLLLERILDSIISSKYNRETSNFVTYFEFPKELLLLIIGKDLVLVTYIVPYKAYDLLPGLLLGQDILFTWSYFYNLSKLGNPTWTLLKVFAIACIFAIANLITSWISMSEQAYNNSDLYIIIQTLVAVAFFILFYVIGTWCIYVRKNLDDSTDMLTYMKIVQTSVFAFFFLLYLLADWFAVYFPSWTSYPEWNTFGVNYLTLMVYMMSGCTALVSIVSGRVSKWGGISYSGMSNELDRLA